MFTVVSNKTLEKMLRYQFVYSSSVVICVTKDIRECTIKIKILREGNIIYLLKQLLTISPDDAIIHGTNGKISITQMHFIFKSNPL